MLLLFELQSFGRSAKRGWRQFRVQSVQHATRCTLLRWHKRNKQVNHSFSFQCKKTNFTCFRLAKQLFIVTVRLCRFKSSKKKIATECEPNECNYKKLVILQEQENKCTKFPSVAPIFAHLRHFNVSGVSKLWL